MKAKTGAIDAHDVEVLRTKAEEFLTQGDYLRTAVTQFATLYLVHRHDPAQVAQMGEELRHAVEVASAAGPADQGRLDLDG